MLLVKRVEGNGRDRNTSGQVSERSSLPDNLGRDKAFGDLESLGGSECARLSSAQGGPVRTEWPVGSDYASISIDLYERAPNGRQERQCLQRDAARVANTYQAPEATRGSVNQNRSAIGANSVVYPKAAVPYRSSTRARVKHTLEATTASS